jgi:predicted dehydrogenase
MIDQLTEISAACDLRIPKEYLRPIAVIGAGNIVDGAHLPNYANLGIEVTGIYDLDRGRAEALAEKFGIARVYASLDEALSDPRAEIVDIALPAAVQPPVVEAALRAGRHVLAQKPLALDSQRALELVELAEEQNRYLCVNQQARFDEGVMAARAMIERGWIGQPVGFEMSVIRGSHWASWYVNVPELELWYHSIHEIDILRSWFGTPTSAWCGAGTVPGQNCAGETNVVCGFSFSADLHGVYRATSENRTGENVTRFRIDGSEGAIEGDFGRFAPTAGSRFGRPDHLRVWSRTLPTTGWLVYPCTKRWFLDAFAGPIGTLFRAVATKTPPVPAARDNVDTIRLIEKLYVSMRPPAGASLDISR